MVEPIIVYIAPAGRVWKVHWLKDTGRVWRHRIPRGLPQGSQPTSTEDLLTSCRRAIFRKSSRHSVANLLSVERCGFPRAVTLPWPWPPVTMTSSFFESSLYELLYGTFTTRHRQINGCSMLRPRIQQSVMLATAPRHITVPPAGIYHPTD